MFKATDVQGFADRHEEKEFYSALKEVYDATHSGNQCPGNHLISEVEENCIQVSVLFSALLLQLPSGKDHIVRSKIRPKSALCLWYDIVCDSF